VTLHSAIESLYSSLHQLRDTVRSLALTVIEDRPTDSEMRPVEELGISVETLVGFADEAIEAAIDGMQAAEPPANLHRVGTALHRSHEHVDQAALFFASEVGACDRCQQLRTIASARGHEWSLWVSAVDDALNHSGHALFGLFSGFRGWLSRGYVTARRSLSTVPAV
jgi:hypothetical protein